MIIEDEIQHSACLTTVTEKTNPMIMQLIKTKVISREIRNFRGRRPLQCAYCHFTVHTKESFYKLIGYPSDQKHKNKNDYVNTNFRGSWASN